MPFDKICGPIVALPTPHTIMDVQSDRHQTLVELAKTRVWDLMHKVTQVFFNA